MNYLQMQPHQCFMISYLARTMSGVFPWELLQAALVNIIVFEKDFLECHRILHLHGNFIANYFLSCIPMRLLPREYKAMEKSEVISLLYRHVWFEVDDYKIKVLHRGNTWYKDKEECILQAKDFQPESNTLSLSDGKRIILSTESVCECLLNKEHNLRCSCLCHCRQCTHYLNDHMPKLESCRCVDAKTTIIDNVKVCRAPYRKPSCIDEGYIFYIPLSDTWFTSHEKNIEESYYLYIDKITK